MVPINDPSSPLAPGNRLDTCRKCHPYAVENFCDFDAHADHTDWEANPTLHLVYVGMEVLLYSVFSFFGLHAALWFVRSLVHTRKHGRPPRLKARQRAFVRFEPFHRTIHAIVIVSFLGLALTGLPLKYSDQPWARGLAFAMGGFDSTSVWHRICALTTFFYFAAHLSWLANRVFLQRRERVPWKTILVGPDSPVPNLRDAQDLLRMGRWFTALGPKPVFERWTYWEKFDYWAVFWGVAIIGSTGLALWFPNLFSRFLPGEALNIAKVIHSEEALLATGFIFAIHFFNTHLRPEKFPVDLSMLTGLVTDEELREERPEHLERMRQQCLEQTPPAGPGDEHPERVEEVDEEQRLFQVRDTSPSHGVLWAVIWAGFVALGIGLCLLAGMILAGLGG
jgi:cytochrome b subunit of formate dehydrogenase